MRLPLGEVEERVLAGDVSETFPSSLLSSFLPANPGLAGVGAVTAVYHVSNLDTLSTRRRSIGHTKTV